MAFPATRSLLRRQEIRNRKGGREELQACLPSGNAVRTKGRQGAIAWQIATLARKDNLPASGFCQKFYERAMRNGGQRRKGFGGVLGSRVAMTGFGFIALVPRWILKWGSEWSSLPTHLGPEVGAQVASLRSPILRPDQWKFTARAAQLASACWRILFHFPCRVVTELSSGRGTGAW